MRYPFLVIDTETTGLGEDDEVIEFGAVDPLGRKVFHCLVKPERHAEWPEAEKINGISPDDVAFALPGSALSPAVSELLSSAGFIAGYNIRFDLRLLRQSGFAIPEGIRACDIMDLVVEHFGKRMSLSKASDFLGTGMDGLPYLGNAHSACADARTALLVMEALSAERMVRMFDFAEKSMQEHGRGM